MDKEDQITYKEMKIFREMKDKISWAAEHTRLDIAYDAEELKKKKEANYKDLEYANEMIKKVKRKQDITVKYPRLGNIEDLSVILYTDSSYRKNGEQVKKISGKFIILRNQEGECAPLAWESKITRRRSKSKVLKPWKHET